MARNKKEILEDQQLKLELKDPPINFFYKIKERLYYQYKIFEMQRYFRNFTVWFLITLTVTVITIQIYYLQEYITELPQKIPLLQMYLSLEKRLIPHSYLLAIPVITAIFLILSVILSYIIFIKNKYLAILTLFYTTISGGLLTYLVIDVLKNYINV